MEAGKRRPGGRSSSLARPSVAATRSFCSDELISPQTKLEANEKLEAKLANAADKLEAVVQQQTLLRACSLYSATI